MATDYGIYLQTRSPKSGRQLESVLLSDGMFTDENNCFEIHFGSLRFKPRLFSSTAAARLFAKKHGYTGRRYRIRKYAGRREA